MSSRRVVFGRIKRRGGRGDGGTGMLRQLLYGLLSFGGILLGAD